MKPTTVLRDLLARREAAILPGAPNAMFARVIERQGFGAIYVTGAGIANMHLGAPDIGLTTVTEVADIVARIADATEMPLLVDADTGFGNALNTVRTVRLLERAGAAGLQLEDQVFPKRCGHFAGKDVIPEADMVAKIRAAVDARKDGDLQIVARTDARAIHGLDAALDRARAYIEAGADVTFVEAPTSEEEMARIAAELLVPQIANIVHGGKTPEVGRERLAEMGFGGVLYANAILQASIRAASDVARSLADHGDLSGVSGRLAGFEERQDVVDKGRWDDLEARYRVTDGESDNDA
ncbi:isocitrate lyase/phosphoenolpyruvate mutase family protein [Roseicyclus sp. F158]|uniref:Isocitrate lyase/phosphoenolpyruvate mutase family protein n=1 Tax=Tropicimonas omnivorans TaxID=3075590 RepID=A0ABU3DF84_9RHOB|nr:isocitrate lyase/phosphoenolpyruvate mutase family protein [Roseicyclus sp. F158]MDT0682213.1 isocitrate lyase/phosphoenolpyruvate mutase family protein [Roseicyclus sp. F158]